MPDFLAGLNRWRISWLAHFTPRFYPVQDILLPVSAAGVAPITNAAAAFEASHPGVGVRIRRKPWQALNPDALYRGQKAPLPDGRGSVKRCKPATGLQSGSPRAINTAISDALHTEEQLRRAMTELRDGTFIKRR
jgi:hypothetical protein